MTLLYRQATIQEHAVSKCAEIVFKRGKVVREEGLEVLEERIKMMNPDENEIYKFFGKEQVDGIKTKKFFEQVKAKSIRGLRC